MGDYMRAAQLDNNKVINIIEVESLDVLPNLIDAGNGNIGDTWDGTQFVTAPAPPEPVPTTVSMRQARLALLQIGKLSEVDTVIDSLPEPQKSAARIEWEYALDVARTWPTLLALAPLLGLDDAALDALFVEAAKL